MSAYLVSYIKPQLVLGTASVVPCCISLVSYIKPQLRTVKGYLVRVVYLWFPTSNHNNRLLWKYFPQLYIFGFLHQTTTPQYGDESFAPLYIFGFLHQTTTGRHSSTMTGRLYIFGFLHQTTTLKSLQTAVPCCISLVSYIKPQQRNRRCGFLLVVYLWFPTSNHNITTI